MRRPSPGCMAAISSSVSSVCLVLPVGWSGIRSIMASANSRQKEKDLGDDLLSQTVASPVPSAQAGLTAVFGMGTGVSPPLWSPKSLSVDRECEECDRNAVRALLARLR